MNPPTHHHNRTLLLGLTGLLAGLVVLSIGIGEVFFPPWRWPVLLSGPEAGAYQSILWEIRAPRTALALLAGAMLGLAGAVLQGYTRNPLADAGILGITGGATLAAVLAIYSGFTLAWPWGLPVAALVGGTVTTLLVVWLAGRGGDVQTLVLAGSAIAALTAALTSLALNLAPNPYAVMEIVFWLLGSVKDTGWNQITLAAPFCAVGFFLLLGTRRGLQALALGDDTAATLGIGLANLRLRVILGTALAVGPVCAAAGSIAFVGLVVPHLLRPFTKNDPGRLLFPSTLGGAILVLAADIVSRLIPTPSNVEIKLGVLTALIGAPFFFALIFKLRKTLP
ncbi:MAG: iron ABC transporter permease [Candidatus Methylacidiphilales bacterium]|nr:iron ABC transporter permease [Candidatus Methylacidiphilales bacterium]